MENYVLFMCLKFHPDILKNNIKNRGEPNFINTRYINKLLFSGYCRGRSISLDVSLLILSASSEVI